MSRPAGPIVYGMLYKEDQDNIKPGVGSSWWIHSAYLIHLTDSSLCYVIICLHVIGEQDMPSMLLHCIDFDSFLIPKVMLLIN